MSFIDFGALKGRVTIEQAVGILGLSLKNNGHQLRGPCPACQQGGDRALVVTPAKGLFYCFSKRVGGDQIALAAHIRGVTVKDAAAFLAGTGTSTSPRPSSTVPVPATVPAEQKGQLKPLDYLQPQHEAVQALGISAETCRAFGAGYASKGIMRGRLAIPVHDRAGTLLAYCGRGVKNESPTLTFPNGFDPHSVIFNANRAQEGELYLVRDPLQVLQAFESGVENVVAFLSDGISPQQFEMLSSLMDEHKCESAQLY
jgi:DNA primase